MKRTALLGLAALFVVASPAHADIKFVGQSRASPQLKHDVLVVIASYAKGVHACGTITTVESAPLGDSYEPKTPLYRVAEPGHLYERWVAELCGTAYLPESRCGLAQGRRRLQGHPPCWHED